MKNTIIITHGEFGKELLKSVEMIIGKQTKAVAFSLNPGENLESFKSIIEDYMSENEKYTIFVDLYGGTPFNISGAMISKNVKVITGVNMPMLLEYFTHEEIDIDKLLDASKISIKYVNRELGQD
jgi:mannose/fructose/sorbose-specific phosphotransferase system IIA component